MAATQAADIVALTRRIHCEQLALCDHLENIADSLPDGVDSAACTQLAQSVTQVLARAHSIEEELLFPCLEAASIAAMDLKPTLERLRGENRADAYFAEELHDVLLSYGTGHPSQTVFSAYIC